MSDQPRRGLEQALVRAAADPAFRTRLLADRSRAALQEGIDLTDSERTVLDSVPATQLETMIPELPTVLPSPPPPPAVFEPLGIRPEEMRMVRGHTSRVAKIAIGAVAVGAVGVGVGSLVCVTHGHTAEVPPPHIEEKRPPPPRARPDAGAIDRSADGEGSAPKR